MTAVLTANPLRADRPLTRVRNLPDDIRQRVINCPGLNTCRDVLDLPETALVDKLNLYLPDVRSLVQAVALHVAQPPPTALGLLRGETSAAAATYATAPTISAVPTGLANLDAHLRGGLPMRALTELVGPAGAGKTQLCLSVAARALVDGSAHGARVVYIDTEGSFSATRLHELLQPRTPIANELLRRVTVLKPSSWAEYNACLHEQLDEELLRDDAAAHQGGGLSAAVQIAAASPGYGRVALLIVDSIAMAVHRHFDKKVDEVLKRQAAVGQHAARLKHVADQHGVCVLCVNQVVGQLYDKGDAKHGPAAEGDVSAVVGQEDGQLLAYLGTAWAHCVNVRLALQHPLQHEVANQPPPAPPIGLVGERNVRPMVARVAKAPMCCEASFGYRVAAEGLVSVSV